MRVPLSYNFRNLAVRKTTTVMTALGISLTVAVLLGISALHAAAARGNTAVHKLLASGADPNTKADKRTPLHLAAERGHMEVVVMTQASSRKQALQSLREAVELWFESCIDRGVLDAALREVAERDARLL